MARTRDYSKHLPEAVAAKYRCTAIPGVYITRAPDREKVDLRKISVADADRLVKAGKLPQLRPLPVKPKSTE